METVLHLSAHVPAGEAQKHEALMRSPEFVKGVLAVLNAMAGVSAAQAGLTAPTITGSIHSVQHR